MTPKKLIEGIKEELDRSLDSYKEIYINTEINAKTDSYYKKAISFFRKLKKEDQDTFFEIIRQTKIDNTATFLSLIDGVFWLKNQEADFKLVYGDSEEKVISGDLSDLFLELIENQETENNL